jgi:flagellar biosynthetic protein FlhB
MSASEASREDRQLEASERRLQQARAEGQLPRSRELVHLAAVLALLALVAGAGPWAAEQALHIVASGLSFDRATAFETGRIAPRVAAMTFQALLLLVPLAAGLALLFALASIAVGGWNFSTEALAPKFERLDPLAGLGRMFDRGHLLQHLRLVAVAAALLAGGWFYVTNHAQDIDALARMALPQAIAGGFGWMQAGLAILAGVCFASAIADVPLQIWQHRSGLRMTHDEARQENKESEGDPHMKGERRRRARELSRGRMLAEVPKASVVVTNPTHYSVALQYDEAAGGAPRIVAMGADHLALKIREVAAASKVPVMEAPPLARALYRHGEVGREIPVELYTAVAQVLAWVYRLRTALQPAPLPQIAVPPGLDPHEAAA